MFATCATLRPCPGASRRAALGPAGTASGLRGAGFEDGKLAHEHIYWVQASLLVQVGLLDPAGLPVAGLARRIPCRFGLWYQASTRRRT